MPNNNSIDTWTREECEEYLKQYPKSLKSDAVRKRFRVLIPQPQPTSKTAGNDTNVAEVVDAVKQTKEGMNCPPKDQSLTLEDILQSSSIGQQEQSTSSTHVDAHENGMAFVGKVVLSVLAFALCIVLVWGLAELFGVSFGLAGKAVSVAVAVPLEAWIWKK